MPGDGEDAIGLDQKPEGTGKPDRSASAPRHRVGVAGRDSTPCMSGLEKTMPAALTAQVLSGLSLGLIGNAPARARGRRRELGGAFSISRQEGSRSRLGQTQTIIGI